MVHRHHQLLLVVLLAVAVATAVVAPVAAQPFGSWAIFDRDEPGDYFQIPHSAALNPTGPLTIEGWVDVSDPSGCSNIIGKGFTETWWVGLCGTSLRSYLRGGGSARTAGDIGATGWHHFAVTWDGSERCHYVDGVEARCWSETPGPLPTNSEPVRIGSDVDFAAFPPNGAINEIRLWNVARSVEQIRETINEPITSPMPGLVAVWAQGGPDDVVGPFDGVEVGLVPRLTFPVTTGGCVTSTTSLCLHDRFIVTVDWRTSTDSGQGTVTPPSTPRSGIFWFFSHTNWEVMVKVLDGCAPVLGEHWWVFTAATTNVFYRLEVFDTEGGANKVFFNYAGPPAPAVTDTQALDTCP